MKQIIWSSDALLDETAREYYQNFKREELDDDAYKVSDEDQKADYVGNICMDVAMIDVTDIPCKEGDSVEIFGEHLPVQTLSDILETIPYEVLTTISNRVKRVYFQD